MRKGIKSCHVKNLLDMFGVSDINRFAKETGFTKRKPRKISPLSLLAALSNNFFVRDASLNTICESIFLSSKEKVSKQAVFKRFTKEWMLFIKKILEELIKSKHKNSYEGLLAKGKFGRILLEDSTTVAVNRKLANVFPGSVNQTNKPSAIVKIYSCYDLLKNNFTEFDLMAYTNNDQSCADKIVATLRPKDLLLRDLGFFKISSLGSIINKKAYFVTRYRQGLSLFSINNQSEIDLIKMLKSKKYINQNPD